MSGGRFSHEERHQRDSILRNTDKTFPCTTAVFIALSCCSLGMICPVTADELDIVDQSKAAEVMKGEKDNIPYLSKEAQDYIDEKQVELSRILIDAATWFDSFFGDERYLSEKNQSNGRLRLSAGLDRHDGLKIKPRIRLKVHLPQASERLNLLISAHDDTDFALDQDPVNLDERDNDKGLSGALQYFLLQTGKMNISTTSGVGLDYLYGGLRYRGRYDYGSWQGRFVSSLYWYTDDGWDFRNQYDIERQVSDDLVFRTTVDGRWEEEEDGLPHGITFSLFQVLDLDKALHYDIGNYFNTEPSYKMTDLVFSLRYRQRFYRDYLVFEVNPRVSFPEEYNRDINPGIIFRLEAQFGYSSYVEEFKRIFSF